MEKYTEDIHAKQLLKVLEQPNPCRYCPASLTFGRENFFRTQEDRSDACTLCRGFVGLKTRSEFFSGLRCPCSVLGPEEAIKRTRIALEEKGYLD